MNIINSNKNQNHFLFLAAIDLMTPMASSSLPFTRYQRGNSDTNGRTKRQYNAEGIELTTYKYLQPPEK